MRVFEVLLCTFAIITLICSCIKKLKNKYLFSLILFVPFLVLHFAFEGIRWQMFGIYAYILYLLVILVFFKEKTDRLIFKFLKAVFFVLVIISTVCIMLFGANDLPELSGEFKVGTMSYDLTDANRNELYNNMTDESRKIRIQIWYPTDDIKGCTQSKWLEDTDIPRSMIETWIGTFPFLLDYATQIDTNGFFGAELSSEYDIYPVVVISHGWMSTKSMHTHHAEMLASNGYIVLNIDHTYGSLATAYEDGTVAKIDLNALPESDDVSYSINLVETYSRDAYLVLNHISDLNIGALNNPDIIISSIDDNLSIFEGRIDIENIGVVGHSTGGGGMAKLAITDDRCKAVFGFDPWVAPVGKGMLNEGIDVPCLFLRSQDWEDGENNEYLWVLTNATEDVLNYQIDYTTHQDFTLLSVFDPITKILGLSGDLDTDKNMEIQLEYLLKFFDEHLKGKEVAVETLVDKYDEISVVNFE